MKIERKEKPDLVPFPEIVYGSVFEIPDDPLQDCGRGHEQLHGIKDNPDPTCPFCDSPRISKRVSPATFILKGEGWFRDGYSSKKPSSSGSS